MIIFRSRLALTIAALLVDAIAVAEPNATVPLVRFRVTCSDSGDCPGVAIFIRGQRQPERTQRNGWLTVAIPVTPGKPLLIVAEKEGYIPYKGEQNAPDDPERPIDITLVRLPSRESGGGDTSGEHSHPRTTATTSRLRTPPPLSDAQIAECGRIDVEAQHVLNRRQEANEEIKVLHAEEKPRDASWQQRYDAALDTQSGVVARFQSLRARLGVEAFTHDGYTIGYSILQSNLKAFVDWQGAGAEPTKNGAPFFVMSRSEERVRLFDPAHDDSSIPRIIDLARNYKKFNIDDETITERKADAEIKNIERFAVRKPNGPVTMKSTPVLEAASRDGWGFQQGRALAAEWFKINRSLIDKAGEIIVENEDTKSKQECLRELYYYSTETQLQSERSVDLYVSADHAVKTGGPRLAYEVAPARLNFAPDHDSYVQVPREACLPLDGVAWKAEKERVLRAGARGVASNAGWWCHIDLKSPPLDRGTHAPLFIIFVEPPFAGCRSVEQTRRAVEAEFSKAQPPGPKSTSAETAEFHPVAVLASIVGDAQPTAPVPSFSLARSFVASQEVATKIEYFDRLANTAWKIANGLGARSIPSGQSPTELEQYRTWLQQRLRATEMRWFARAGAAQVVQARLPAEPARSHREWTAVRYMVASDGSSARSARAATDEWTWQSDVTVPGWKQGARVDIIHSRDMQGEATSPQAPVIEILDRRDPGDPALARKIRLDKTSEWTEIIDRKYINVVSVNIPIEWVRSNEGVLTLNKTGRGEAQCINQFFSVGAEYPTPALSVDFHIDVTTRDTRFGRAPRVLYESLPLGSEFPEMHRRPPLMAAVCHPYSAGKPDVAVPNSSIRSEAGWRCVIHHEPRYQELMVVYTELPLPQCPTIEDLRGMVNQ